MYSSQRAWSSQVLGRFPRGYGYVHSGRAVLPKYLVIFRRAITKCSRDFFGKVVGDLRSRVRGLSSGVLGEGSGIHRIISNLKLASVEKGMRRGRDESERRRAESQWIVAARPLCHLQYPVAYLSRLQRILPAARWELRFKEARTACPPRGLHLRHVPLGAIGPYCGSAIGRRARASLLARILT